VEATIAQIAEHPESGPRLPGYPYELEVRAFRVRTFRYTLIVATVNRERVVYAVAHQHRRPGYWQDRLK
jgi:plasmid stabilization system protein ParE